MAEEVKPCPFCGRIGVTVREGSTFRWRVAECNYCGAQCGEIRAQTAGKGAREDWEKTAQTEAIKEWNRRAPIELASGGTITV